MKTTLTTSDIAHALKNDSNANWSWAGANALTEYLEDYEENSGEEMELDVVAIRCDFSEYSSLSSWAVEYFGGTDAINQFDVETEEDLDDCEDAIRNYINDHGQLIEFTGGIIVSSF
jgi:hypothetical protein